MGDFAYENVPVAVRKSPDGLFYDAGLVIDGAFHRFAQYKVGGFDDRQKKAQDAAQQASDTSSNSG